MQLDKNKILEDAWLGIHVKEETMFNPMKEIPEEYREHPHLYVIWLMQRPEYFSFFCKTVLNLKLLPFQLVFLYQLWTHKFPLLIASRGAGKSFILAIYCILRMVFLPGRRIIICGAGFRQSKVVFSYMETIWRNSPILRDMYPPSAMNGPKHEPDMWRFHLGDSICLAIPVGDGSTIRGLRANDIIVDEFAAGNRDVFETVIKGFAAVSSDPADNVRTKAAKDLAKRLGWDIHTQDETIENLVGNQIILSGTAYYDFNHFAEYWKKWKAIIKSKGDERKIKDIFSSDDKIPEDFDWKQYLIIRYPYELIPKGFMDDAIVQSARASSHIGIYQMEFGSVFSRDSYGFFKRSLIESCVISPTNNIELPSGKIMFNATLSGNPTCKYIYAVDPASEKDRFTIIVLELHPDHRRIVYAWSTNKVEFNEKLKAGLVKETDFYGYCARKIRDLMKKFPCERIMIDSQGGGIAVNEALHDNDKLQLGELPLWPVIVPGESKDTDGNAGKHIIELVNFASSDWTTEANHGMKKDMEDKVLLFPYFDTASLGLAAISDTNGNILYDTLEDCIMEIEELKNELSTIVLTQTETGREKWDTPEIKLPGNKKGRLRKDRYSALLMANMGARTLVRNPQMKMTQVHGGFAGNVEHVGGRMVYGPEWIASAYDDLY